MTLLVFICEGSSMHTGVLLVQKGSKKDQKLQMITLHAWAADMLWKKKNVARRSFACAHVCIFEELVVCVCVCTFPVGPPHSIFPLSQCWNHRRSIKARLPSCDFSVSRLSALTLLDWGMLSNSLRWQLVLWCLRVSQTYFKSHWLRNITHTYAQERNAFSLYLLFAQPFLTFLSFFHFSAVGPA